MVDQEDVQVGFVSRADLYERQSPPSTPFETTTLTPPFHHEDMNIEEKIQVAYQRLNVERDFGAGRRAKVLYVNGGRSDESVRRMGNVPTEPEPHGRTIWLSPIHDWTKQDTSDLIEFTKAKRNLVVDLIHKSGECLCGAFAKKGELEELALWPQTRPAYERIKALEKRVMEKFPWGWEDSPPKEYLEEKRGQLFIPETKQHLCWKCLQANPTLSP